MKNVHFITTKALLTMYFQQISLQAQLLEAQQKVIELQARIDEMTPPNPPDDEVYWHISSGMLSTEAANSNNIVTLKKFRQWNINFANRNILPYVSPKVYGECLNQMTRGLSEKIATLETKADSVTITEPKSIVTNTSSQTPKQMSLALVQ